MFTLISSVHRRFTGKLVTIIERFSNALIYHFQLNIERLLIFIFIFYFTNLF